VAVKKGLQVTKNRKNMPAEKVASLDAADTAEKEERRLIAAESLAADAKRLADSAAALVALVSRSAVALEGLRSDYEIVVSRLCLAAESLLIWLAPTYSQHG
jgi:hypothetical protein